MVTRKTQYGWMALGGLLCLFALFLTLKLRDGNKVVAQSDDVGYAVPDPSPPPPVSEEKKSGPAKDEAKKASELKPLEETSKPLPPLGAPLPGVAAEEKLAPPAAVKADPPLPPPTVPKLSDPVGVTPPPPLAVPGAGTKQVDSIPDPTPPPSERPNWMNPRMVGPSSGVIPVSATEVSGSPDKAPDKTKAEPPPPPLVGAGVPPPPPASLPAYGPRPTVPVDPPPPASEAKTSPMPPVAAGPKEREEKAQPGEPPLAPAPGPVQMYEVHGKAETLADIARKTLGSSTRLSDIHRLNPNLKPDAAVAPGTVVKLPGDACVPTDEIEAVRPLPALRPKPPVKARVVLPLTGTYPVNLDDQKRMTLPKAIRDQLAGADMVLVSPGTDQCLWMTNQAHLDRLAQKLERSPAQEADVRVFKRLYFAQTEKAPLGSDGRVAIPERLAQFAGLHQEVVLVGIDDHFEVWDAARWRQYTQQKSAAARSAAPADHDHE